MIVTGMDIKSGDLKYCPACGNEGLEHKGSYHGNDGEYKQCPKCYTRIYLGLDGRDW